MSQYPEHEKLKKVSDRSQAIGEFLEWAFHEEGLSLMDWCEDMNEYVPHGRSINDLLAEFFGIDQNELEKEKQAMLAELRAMNA